MSGPGFGFRHVPGPGAKLKSTRTMKRGPWPMDTGKKLQATSAKLQAASRKQQAPSNKLKNIIESFLDRGPRISNREA